MKSEKEKMLAGEVYDPYVPELAKERASTKEKLYHYNQLPPILKKAREAILERILGSIKGNFNIALPFNCDYGSNIYIGKNFFSNFNCVILDSAKVTIGDNVLFGPNVCIYTVNHVLEPEARKKGLEFAKPVNLENNVWIGGNTVILPGVTIGENSVIGAGSVVTKDVPANVVAVGNPCKVIKSIYD